jgi:hypothetical protein
MPARTSRPRRERSTSRDTSAPARTALLTTTVPAILSCQPCFFGSNATQRRRGPNGMSRRSRRG